MSELIPLRLQTVLNSLVSVLQMRLEPRTSGIARPKIQTFVSMDALLFHAHPQDDAFIREHPHRYFQQSFLEALPDFWPHSPVTGQSRPPWLRC
jgi:hypothetical protein